MLARLAGVPGVRAAAIDHTGRFLRLTGASPTTVVSVRESLTDLGYEARDLPEDEEVRAAVAVARWHARDSVFEMSREESEVVATRVATAFAAEVGLDDDRRERLRDIVQRGLYSTFITRDHRAGSLITAAIPAIVEEAAPLLDPAQRTALIAHILHGVAR